MFNWLRKIDPTLAQVEITDVLEKLFVVAFQQLIVNQPIRLRII